jgi:hypothetical protein
MWSINAGNISSKNDFAELHTLCVSLQSRSVDAIALQECNVDFMQASVRDKFTEIFKEHFGQARVITATSCISAPCLWKPGGEMLAILGPWAQHVANTTCDDLCRWAIATLTGSDGNSFTLVSLYNVVNVKLQHAGPSTIFAQQYRLLRLAGVLTPNPQHQYIDDLHRTVAKMIANQEAE